MVSEVTQHGTTPQHAKQYSCPSLGREQGGCPATSEPLGDGSLAAVVKLGGVGLAVGVGVRQPAVEAPRAPLLQRLVENEDVDQSAKERLVLVLGRVVYST